MRAAVYADYGSPDVLHVVDREIPVPRDNEVLVRSRASSLNAADLDLLKGVFMVRAGGLFKPMYKILGSDIAGEVAAVGQNVTRFAPGDEVYGDLSGCGFGAFAEYTCAPETAVIAKPSSMTFEEAATFPQSAVLALQGLQTDITIQAGSRVLVNGAGGGMGTFAVQIAKTYGAEVTAVDSAQKLTLLQSIGSDYLIDYETEDFTENGERYDVILDGVASRSIAKCIKSLRSGGSYVVVGGSPSAAFQAMFIGPLISKRSGKSARILMWRPNDEEDLATLTDLFERDVVRPVIDRSFPLSQIADAFRLLDAGDANGKIVITM